MKTVDAEIQAKSSPEHSKKRLKKNQTLEKCEQCLVSAEAENIF